MTIRANQRQLQLNTRTTAIGVQSYEGMLRRLGITKSCMLAGAKEGLLALLQSSTVAQPIIQDDYEILHDDWGGMMQLTLLRCCC